MLHVLNFDHNKTLTQLSCLSKNLDVKNAELVQQAV